MAIRRFHVKPVAIHAHAAIPNGAAGIGRISIVPEFTPRAGIHGPRVIRRGEIQDAVNHKRRGLDSNCGRRGTASSACASAGDEPG